VVDKVALGQVFSSSSVSLANHSPIAPHSSSSGAATIGQIVADPPRNLKKYTILYLLHPFPYYETYAITAVSRVLNKTMNYPKFSF
jgi:hypothetical protein